MKNRVVKLSAKFVTDAIAGKAVNVASNLPSNFELLNPGPPKRSALFTDG
jgi:hypothetical protein